MEEADWERLIDQLERGDCTPFLGAGACHGVLPTGSALSNQWATRYDYPFTDRDDLARVMQYAAIREGDPVTLKQKVCRYLTSIDPPDFGDPAEPHALLAEFPIPIFVTTNYDDFLVRALRAAGKQPNSTMCSWSAGMDYDKEFFDSRPGMSPQYPSPLVYHLHGRMGMPKSLVLTENDYLEFLAKIASNHDSEPLLIPSVVLSAFANNPLLFIGYSLQDWTFRVIFHGILSAIPDVHRRRHVSIQLLPPLNGSTADIEEQAKLYMTEYLEKNWNISVFWGSVTDFCRELRMRVGLTR